MRVVYFHQHFSTRSGQAGTRSYEFARNLVANGDHVDLICGRNEKSNFDFEAKGRRQIVEIDGINVHVINVPYAPQMGFLRRVLAFFSYAFWASIEGLRCSRPDLIFATSTPITVAIPGMIASLFKRRPLVFEVRDIWPESAVATGVLKNKLVIKLAEMFERLIYRRSKKIIALSERMKLRMVKNTGTAPEKIDVIPIGADLDLFGNGKENRQFRINNGFDKEFLAIFPGAHGVANGLDVLVDASMLLPEDIHIIMIGNGARKQHLVNKAISLGSKNIHFFDLIAKTELSKVMSTMNCGLMILDPLEVFETVLPNKFFDYSAARLPIIVNFAGEVADQIRENSAGLFVENSSAQNISEALAQLNNDRKQLKTMSGNARNIAQKFNREDLAEQFRMLLVQSASPKITQPATKQKPVK